MSVNQTTIFKSTISPSRTRRRASSTVKMRGSRSSSSSFFAVESASGGLSIALEAMGKSYLDRGLAAGIDPEVMHRVASLSCGGLDTLPHNGAVITLLIICGATHKQSYWDIAMVSVIGPILSTSIVIAFMS